MIVASGCPAGRAAESGNHEDASIGNGARRRQFDSAALSETHAKATVAGWPELLAVLRNGGPSMVVTGAGHVKWAGGQIPGRADLDSQQANAFWELFTPSSRRDLLDGVNAVATTGVQQSVDLAWADVFPREAACRVSVSRCPLRDEHGAALVVIQFLERDDSGAIERTRRLERTLARIVDELGRLHTAVPPAGGDDDVLAPAPTSPLPESLSARRREVATHVLEGRSIPQVAEALHLSEHTVRNHLKAVYRQLGVSSRAEFMRLYHG